MIFRSVAALLVLFLVSPLVQASEPVTIQRVIPYADGIGTVALRTSCDWNSRLSGYIVADSKGQVVTTDQDPAAIDGVFLNMTVVSIHVIGGGGFTGPKWAKVKGELRSRGKLLGSFVAMRQTGIGFTACSAANRIGKAIANDVANWLQTPTMNARL